MRRVAIAIALSTIWISGCTPPRAIALTPDPARLDACPAGERPFPKLAALVPMTLIEDARVRLDDGSEQLLKAGSDLVLLGTVLDRDEATAVFIVGLRADKARCLAAVLYVKDWGTALGAH
jgi:hypothetical protein